MSARLFFLELFGDDKKTNYHLQMRKEMIMETKQFNDAQLEVLRMVSVFNTPEAVGDLKQAISDYFAKKAEEEIDVIGIDDFLKTL